MNKFQKRRLFHAKAGSKGGRRADLADMFFRSRWEANYARALNAMKERGEIHSWEYESKEWAFPVKRGTRFYKSDFAIRDTADTEPWYAEVKGLMDSKSITALNRMQRYYPEVVILVIDKKRYQQIESEFGHLEGWE